MYLLFDIIDITGPSLTLVQIFILLSLGPAGVRGPSYYWLFLQETPVARIVILKTFCSTHS